MLSTTANSALCITVTIVCAIALVGNILVLTAIIKSRRLHTTSNIYICALAITDIVISLVHPVKYILKTFHVNISYLSCGIVLGTSLLGCFTNLMMIEIISIDRFYAIYWPFQYRKFCTKSKAIKVSMVATVLSAGFGGLVFGIFMPAGDFTSCWSGEILTVPIATLMTVITCSVALELTVMYGAMFYKAVKHQKHLSQGYFNKNCTDMTILDIKALKTCCVVLGSFLMMWTPPLVVINLAAHSNKANYDLALLLCMMLPAFNSALDPLVYAVMRLDIRKGIHRLFMKGDRQVCTQVECD